MRNINIVRVIMRALKKFNDPYYQGSPAEIGFYFIFSVIPMLTIMLQLLSYFDITNQIMDKVMLSFADNSAVISVISAVHSALSSRFSFMFAILALWSASKIEFSLIRISNYTYGIADTNTILGYFKDRFHSSHRRQPADSCIRTNFIFNDKKYAGGIYRPAHPCGLVVQYPALAYHTGNLHIVPADKLSNASSQGMQAYRTTSRQFVRLSRHTDIDHTVFYLLPLLLQYRPRIRKSDSYNCIAAVVLLDRLYSRIRKYFKRLMVRGTVRYGILIFLYYKHKFSLI